MALLLLCHCILRLLPALREIVIYFLLTFCLPNLMGCALDTFFRGVCDRPRERRDRIGKSGKFIGHVRSSGRDTSVSHTSRMKERQRVPYTFIGHVCRSRHEGPPDLFIEFRFLQ